MRWLGITFLSKGRQKILQAISRRAMLGCASYWSGNMDQHQSQSWARSIVPTILGNMRSGIGRQAAIDSHYAMRPDEPGKGT